MNRFLPTVFGAGHGDMHVNPCHVKYFVRSGCSYNYEAYVTHSWGKSAVPPRRHKFDAYAEFVLAE